MNKLPFDQFFNDIENFQYSVVKLSPDFPNYDSGDDIDIYCREIEPFSRAVISYLQKYVDQVFTIRVTKKKNKIQVDLLEGKLIHFRFDLISEIPNYKNIKIKASFFDVVIENSTYKEIYGFKIKVPKIEDECILRYVEYIEYFGKIPDKIKHTDYINNLVEEGVMSQAAFLDRLYYFTLIPEDEYQSKSLKDKFIERIVLFQTLLEKTKHLLKTKGVSALMAKILQRLK